MVNLKSHYYGHKTLRHVFQYHTSSLKLRYFLNVSRHCLSIYYLDTTTTFCYLFHNFQYLSLHRFQACTLKTHPFCGNNKSIPPTPPITSNNKTFTEWIGPERVNTNFPSKLGAKILLLHSKI